MAWRHPICEPCCSLRFARERIGSEQLNFSSARSAKTRSCGGAQKAYPGSDGDNRLKDSSGDGNFTIYSSNYSFGTPSAVEAPMVLVAFSSLHSVVL